MEIGDEEVVYRRIPASKNWYDPESGELDRSAFNPHYNRREPDKSRDIDGLSVNRAPSKTNADFLTPEMLCITDNPDRFFYVAILNVCDLRRHGMQVVANPVEGNSGHALIPGIHSMNRKSDQVREWVQLLAESLTQDVLGPYPQ